MDISFLTSSNRPNALENVIKTINDIGQTFEGEYEICVFSLSKVDQPNTKWFEDNGEKGPLFGYNLLAQKSTGQILSVLVDDHIPSYNLFDIKGWFKRDEFINKKLHITTLRSGSPCWIPQGPPFPDNRKNLQDSKRLMYRWPVLSRQCFEEYLNGYIWHPNFIYHWADNYLGYFVDLIDGPGIECKDIKLYEIQSYDNSYNAKFDDQDYNTFRRLVDEFNGVNYV